MAAVLAFCCVLRLFVATSFEQKHQPTNAGQRDKGSPSPAHYWKRWRRSPPRSKRCRGEKPQASPRPRTSPASIRFSVAIQRAPSTTTTLHAPHLLRRFVGGGTGQSPLFPSVRAYRATVFGAVCAVRQCVSYATRWHRAPRRWLTAHNNNNRGFTDRASLRATDCLGSEVDQAIPQDRKEGFCVGQEGVTPSLRRRGGGDRCCTDPALF